MKVWALTAENSSIPLSKYLSDYCKNFDVDIFARPEIGSCNQLFISQLSQVNEQPSVKLHTFISRQHLSIGKVTPEPIKLTLN